jgi:transposase
MLRRTCGRYTGLPLCACHGARCRGAPGCAPNGGLRQNVAAYHRRSLHAFPCNRICRGPPTNNLTAHPCDNHKRQAEFIAFLEQLNREIEAPIKTIHPIGDHVSTHHGCEVAKWMTKYPRFILHFTPMHGSWMNQVEQWCSILQRRQLRSVVFESKDQLRLTLEQYMHEWNQQAHPFNWSTKSVATVMANAAALGA